MSIGIKLTHTMRRSRVQTMMVGKRVVIQACRITFQGLDEPDVCAVVRLS